jgi:alkanesulfonate monooxygenase SsuD/methylene tetrahydromethanopterin reductase-like flavin-dependent oxidoreductase (luciferase family)
VARPSDHAGVPVKFGFIITGGEAREQVELAREAEAAGWDAVFTWDGIHVGDDIETYDPWALMGAMAMATERVRLGAILSPLSRRRPWKVARETTTVDRLSNGRLILPVGLGAVDDRGVTGLGEASDRRTRAERLDEALEILTGLWSGDSFGYAGTHYRFEPMAFRPTPMQRPRIPIWVVGAWPSERSMGRVLRYDGWMPHWLPRDGEEVEGTPARMGEARAWIAERRSIDGFDIVIEGTTPADDAAAGASQVQPWADAGATWWIESDWSNWEIGPMRTRIEAGPPAVQAAVTIGGDG